MTKPMTSAQQKQQMNRDDGGRYKNKQHSEASVSLAPALSSGDELYDRISEDLDNDLLTYAHNNAEAAIYSHGAERTAQRDPEDIAQDAIVAVLERYKKNDGEGVRSTKSWLNQTLKNNVTRSSEGRFHWPNSVAIRQYNQAIAEQEQKKGSLTNVEKDKIRQNLLDNWDEINPTMKRHRPQPDFHLHTFRNTAVRLDGLSSPDGDLGVQENIDGFLQDQAEDSMQPASGIEVHEAIQDLEDLRPKAISDNQIASARYAYQWLNDDNAPEIRPSLDKAEFEGAFKKLSISSPKSPSQRAARAIESWEHGEDLDQDGNVKPEIAALMKPFGGEENLSMAQQQSVINTLTRHGRDPHHINRMWSIAATSARIPDQHTAIASQKRKGKTNAA